MVIPSVKLYLPLRFQYNYCILQEGLKIELMLGGGHEGARCPSFCPICLVVAVFDTMVQKGILTTLEIYDNLLSAYAQAEQWENCRRVLASMDNDGMVTTFG